MQKWIPYFLKTVGVILLLVGLVAAYYGPLEIFVFYLFSEGGRFYYDGFGMGSFWFAALVVQNIGYYAIAALFIPVGIGHLRLRRWALTLTRLYLWFWLGAGILLLGNCLFLIPSLYKLDPGGEALWIRAAAVGGAALFFLVFLPLLALWFYQREKVRSAFEAGDPNRYWTERTPFPLLVILLSYVILIVLLHLAIFFQGLFPLFGQILLGRPAAYFIALCILILGILIYGSALREKWAWWGGLAFMALLAISAGLSFAGLCFYDLVLRMDLPAYEMALIDKMVLFHDFPLVGVLAVPLLFPLGLVLWARRYFWGTRMDRLL